MPLLTALFVILAACLTAAVSGIFGMAGGLMLMGALTFVLPVAACFVTHGILQAVSNGWRACLHRRHIVWPIILYYAIAAVLAAGLVTVIALRPSTPVLHLLLGLVAMLVWLPQGSIQLDASRPAHALLSGFLVTATNLTAGVSGPLLDVFFVRTALTRHQIVATKAATQVFSHMAKILIYGGLLTGLSAPGLPQWWVFTLAIPASMLGTVLGGLVLDRMSDTGFRRWTAWILTALGLFFFVRAAQTWS